MNKKSIIGLVLLIVGTLLNAFAFGFFFRIGVFAIVMLVVGPVLMFTGLLFCIYSNGSDESRDESYPFWHAQRTIQGNYVVIEL